MTASYQFIPTQVQRSDGRGALAQGLAAGKPDDPAWLAQAVGAGIGGAAMTRQAAIRAAADVTTAGVAAASSVMNQGTAGMGNVASTGLQSSAAVKVAGMEIKAREKESNRFAGQRLLGLGLVGIGGLYEAFRKQEPLPQRQKVDAPNFTKFDTMKAA
jgi:hypothetical protein